MSIRTLFIGAFKKVGAKGLTGGQAFACTTLVESEWGQTIDWVKVDTTALTNEKRSFRVRFQGAIQRLIQVRKMLRKEPIDVVIIFCSSGFSFVEKGIMARMAKRQGKPVIFAPRSGLIMNDLERSNWMKSFVRKTVQRVDKVMCQGESWRAFYKELSGEPLEKFAVVHNWIIPEPYLKNIPELPSSADDNSLKVLFLGWITTNKGIFDLLEAAEKIKDLPIKIIMGGKGTHFDEMVSLVKERNLEHVMELRGWIHGEDKMAAFRECDAFVLPSYREGYPNALVEAMVSGLPSIATSISSIPDLITDGKNGFLVQPGDPDRLAELFTLLHKDPIKRMEVAKAGRQRILENNTVEIASEKMDRMFSDLIKQ